MRTWKVGGKAGLASRERGPGWEAEAEQSHRDLDGLLTSRSSSVGWTYACDYLKRIVGIKRDNGYRTLSTSVWHKKGQ